MAQPVSVHRQAEDKSNQRVKKVLLQQSERQIFTSFIGRLLSSAVVNPGLSFQKNEPRNLHVVSIF